MASLAFIFSIVSCKSIPNGAVAVKPFDVEKYLGQWYEIARFDFRFERNLNNTTANYVMLPNGKVKVINAGYNTVKNEWSEAIGKAKFKGEADKAELKVSFFGPFYTGYNVIALEGNYEYALVVGKNTDYLWILSRKTSIPIHIKETFLKKAIEIGCDTSKLLWIEHDKAELKE